jgi:hypothetical protein
MDWSVAQVIKHLLCKCKALSSNPNPTPPKKNHSPSTLHKLNPTTCFEDSRSGVMGENAVLTATPVSPALGRLRQEEGEVSAAWAKTKTRTQNKKEAKPQNKTHVQRLGVNNFIKKLCVLLPVEYCVCVSQPGASASCL